MIPAFAPHGWTPVQAACCLSITAVRMWGSHQSFSHRPPPLGCGLYGSWDVVPLFRTPQHSTRRRHRVGTQGKCINFNVKNALYWGNAALVRGGGRVVCSCPSLLQFKACSKPLKGQDFPICSSSLVGSAAGHKASQKRRGLVTFPDSPPLMPSGADSRHALWPCGWIGPGCQPCSLHTHFLWNPEVFFALIFCYHLAQSFGPDSYLISQTISICGFCVLLGHGVPQLFWHLSWMPSKWDWYQTILVR